MNSAAPSHLAVPSPPRRRQRQSNSMRTVTSQQTDAVPSLTPDRRLRVGFVMEQVLGHVAHYQTLRRVLDRSPILDPHWVEVTYHESDGQLERLAFLPPSVRGTARGYLQVRQGLRGVSLDAL